MNQALTLDDVIDTHQDLIKEDIIKYQVKKDDGVLEYEIETQQMEYVFNANNGALIEIDD